jgi:hypothetical protein
METRFIVEYHDNNTGQSIMYWLPFNDPASIQAEISMLSLQNGVEHLTLTEVQVISETFEERDIA